MRLSRRSARATLDPLPHQEVNYALEDIEACHFGRCFRNTPRRSCHRAGAARSPGNGRKAGLHAVVRWLRLFLDQHVHVGQVMQDWKIWR